MDCLLVISSQKFGDWQWQKSFFFENSDPLEGPVNCYEGFVKLFATCIILFRRSFLMRVVLITKF